MASSTRQYQYRLTMVNTQGKTPDELGKALNDEIQDGVNKLCSGRIMVSAEPTIQMTPWKDWIIITVGAVFEPCQ